MQLYIFVSCYWFVLPDELMWTHSWRSELLHTKFLPFWGHYCLRSMDLNFKQCNYAYNFWELNFLFSLDCLPLFSHFHHPICGVFITVCFLSTIILTLLSSKFCWTMLFSGMIWICKRMDQNLKSPVRFLSMQHSFPNDSNFILIIITHNKVWWWMKLKILLQKFNPSHLSFQNFYFEYSLN